jgi:hypothetical protein
LNEREKERNMYRRTEAHVCVEHIEPHIEHLRENEKKKKVSGNIEGVGVGEWVCG